MYIMNGMIKKDIESYSKEYKLKRCLLLNFIHLMIHNKSFRSLFYYRMGKSSKFYSWILPGEPTFHLPEGCKVGEGTIFFHSYGTILSGVVGNDCRLTCNITLGIKNGKSPIIGNRVEILPGAVIVGDVTIGDDCVIGPNCVVHKSVPANCVVVGNPAVILKRNGVIVKEML